MPNSKENLKKVVQSAKKIQIIPDEGIEKMKKVTEALKQMVKTLEKKTG